MYFHADLTSLRDSACPAGVDREPLARQATRRRIVEGFVHELVGRDLQQVRVAFVDLEIGLDCQQVIANRLVFGYLSLARAGQVNQLCLAVAKCNLLVC
jgi:hypothetical protein